MDLQNLLVNILAPRLAVDVFDLNKAAADQTVPSDSHAFAYIIECSIKSYFFKRGEEIPTEVVVTGKWFRKKKTVKKLYTVDWLFNNCTEIELKNLAIKVYELEDNYETAKLLKGEKKKN